MYHSLVCAADTRSGNFRLSRNHRWRFVEVSCQPTVDKVDIALHHVQVQIVVQQVFQQIVVVL